MASPRTLVVGCSSLPDPAVRSAALVRATVLCSGLLVPRVWLIRLGRYYNARPRDRALRSGGLVAAGTEEW